jgi:hypothetical protein
MALRNKVSDKFTVDPKLPSKIIWFCGTCSNFVADLTTFSVTGAVWRESQPDFKYCSGKLFGGTEESHQTGVRVEI